MWKKRFEFLLCFYQLSWGRLPLQCPLKVELCLHGALQRQPAVHCPPLAQSGTRAPALLKGHIKVVSGRYLPAAPGVLSWTQETFLMSVFFKWAPPSEQLLYQWIVVFKKKSQIYFTKEEKSHHYCRMSISLVRTEGCRDIGLGPCLWAEMSDWWLDYMIYKVSSNSDDSVKFWWPSSDHFEMSA